jgi:hypothetical protein
VRKHRQSDVRTQYLSYEEEDTCHMSRRIHVI